jgi:hypothetical protein
LYKKAQILARKGGDKGPPKNKNFARAKKGTRKV